MMTHLQKCVCAALRCSMQAVGGYEHGPFPFFLLQGTGKYLLTFHTGTYFNGPTPSCAFILRWRRVRLVWIMTCKSIIRVFTVSRCQGYKRHYIFNSSFLIVHVQWNYIFLPTADVLPKRYQDPKLRYGSFKPTTYAFSVHITDHVVIVQWLSLQLRIRKVLCSAWRPSIPNEFLCNFLHFLKTQIEIETLDIHFFCYLTHQLSWLSVVKWLNIHSIRTLQCSSKRYIPRALISSIGPDSCHSDICSWFSSRPPAKRRDGNHRLFVAYLLFQITEYT